MVFGDFTVARNSQKRVLHSDGDLKTYAANEPAFEFNADGSYKGLLVEPAATNICLQSEDITTTWTSVDATLTANATTAPDGNTTADKLNDDSGGGTGDVRIEQSINVAAATKYTASVFLKAGDLSFAALTAQDADGASAYTQYFGLSGSGTLGTPTAGIENSSITAYPNGWYRCTITWTQAAGDTNFAFRIYLASSILSTTVNLNGNSSIFVWGAQVETGPIATSYIPTTTTSVPRAADDITMTGASSLIGQTEGTLYVEVDWRLRSGERQYLTRLQSSTVIGDHLYIRLDDGSDVIRFQLEQNGSAKVIDTTQSSVKSGIYKLAFAYGSGDSKLAINGTSITPTSNNTFAFTSTLDEIYLGQDLDANEQANMHIRAVALYSRRLTNSELTSLTS